MKPLRLYLVAALLAFGALALWPQSAVKVVVKDSEPEPQSVNSQPRKPASETDRIFEKALSDPQRFAEVFTANLPRAFFLLLPAFALLLKLLYLRRRILYLDHLVFALHFHAFAFVVMAAATAINESGIPLVLAAVIGISAWIWIFVYLFRALRAVYGGSWLKAGLRFATLLFLYGIVFGFTLFGLMLFTAYRLAS